MTTGPVIELRHARIGYHDRPVLPDVSVTVPAGEVLAVLGANGSGKSTLVKAMLGLLPLAAGTARLFGAPAARFRQRHRVGYVPQRAGAGSGVPATVTELVSSGRLPRRPPGWPQRASDRRAVAAAISAVGLAERGRDPVDTLSGGQQQRALIARALAVEPELLVLDEPTAGVDADSQAAFAAVLRWFVEQSGTVVLVAHELGPLTPLVTRSLVLHEGRVVRDRPGADPSGASPARPGRAGDDPHAAQPHPPDPQPDIWQFGALGELSR